MSAYSATPQDSTVNYPSVLDAIVDDGFDDESVYDRRALAAYRSRKQAASTKRTKRSRFVLALLVLALVIGVAMALAYAFANSQTSRSGNHQARKYSPKEDKNETVFEPKDGIDSDLSENDNIDKSGPASKLWLQEAILPGVVGPVTLSADGSALAVHGSGVYERDEPKWKLRGENTFVGDDILLSADGGTAMRVHLNDRNRKQLFLYGYDSNNRAWSQRGQAIEVRNKIIADYSISGHGKVLATLDENEQGSPVLRVYQLYEGNLNQMGSDIIVDHISVDELGKMGMSMSLSDDGRMLSFGTYTRKSVFAQVHLYEYQSENWSQLTNYILDVASEEKTIGSFTMHSYNGGSTIATIAKDFPEDPTNPQSDAPGFIRIFVYDEQSVSWKQRGGDILRSYFYGYDVGASTAVSRDGMYVAFPGSQLDMDDAPIDGNATTVVFEYSSEFNNWTHYERPIVHSFSINPSEGYSMSISDEGDVVAIGTHMHGTMVFRLEK